MKYATIAIVIVAIVAVGGWQGYKYYKKNNVATNNIEQKIEDKEIAVIETSKGVVKIRLYRSVAPKTVDNFVKLANSGFYENIKFHRVIKEFMIQTGDPLTKDDSKKDQWGTGGSDAQFDDEINPWELGVPEATIKENIDAGYKYDRNLKSLPNNVGAVAMANAGPNTNSSQFFIITEKDQSSLDGKHTVFGHVIDGMDIVKSIAGVKTDGSDRPEEAVIIKKITIEEEQPKPQTEETENDISPVGIKATDSNGNPIDINSNQIQVETVPVK